MKEMYWSKYGFFEEFLTEDECIGLCVENDSNNDENAANPALEDEHEGHTCEIEPEGEGSPLVGAIYTE